MTTTYGTIAAIIIGVLAIIAGLLASEKKTNNTSFKSPNIIITLFSIIIGIILIVGAVVVYYIDSSSSEKESLAPTYAITNSPTVGNINTSSPNYTITDTPTPTITISAPPTDTPTPSPIPTLSPTPFIPTNTPIPTSSPTNSPTPTTVPTKTPTPLPTYSVSYNANGGSNPPNKQMKVYNENLKLSTETPQKDYCDFLGWATSSGGSVVYESGALYTGNGDIELFAVWKDKSVSDWHLISEKPSDARIIEEKWSFTRTTTSTGTYQYADFTRATGFDKNNDLFNKYPKEPLKSQSTPTKVVSVSNPVEQGPYIYFHWCEGKPGVGGPYDRLIKPWYEPDFWKFCAFEAQEWVEETQFRDVDWGGNGVRWNQASACPSCNNWYVIKVYTQTYTEKSITKGESKTAVTGNEYSDIKHYVRYQTK